MQDVYMASHGRYAEGIISALDLLIGAEHNITPISAYCGEIGSTADVARCFEKIAEEAASHNHELVLFTDMQGGSVNNTAVQVMVNYPHMHVVSGANLIMLMEFSMSEQTNTVLRLQDAIHAATHAMQYMNTLPEIEVARNMALTTPGGDTESFFSAEEEQ